MASGYSKLKKSELIELLREKDTKIEELEKENKELKNEIEQKDAEIEELEKENKEMKNEINQKIPTSENILDKVINEGELMRFANEVNVVLKREGKKEKQTRAMYEMYEPAVLLAGYVRFVDKELDIRSILKDDFFNDKKLTKFKHMVGNITFSYKNLDRFPQQGDFQIVVKNDETKQILINIYEVKCTTETSYNHNIKNLKCKQNTGKHLSVEYYDRLQEICNKKGSFKWGENDVKIQYWFISNEPNDEAFYESTRGVRYISYKNPMLEMTDGKMINIKTREVKIPKKSYAAGKEFEVKEITEPMDPNLNDEEYIENFGNRILDKIYG